MSSEFIEKIVNELHKDMRENSEWKESTYEYSVNLSETTRRKHVEMVEEIVNKEIHIKIYKLEAEITKTDSLECQKHLYTRIAELFDLLDNDDEKGDG